MRDRSHEVTAWLQGELGDADAAAFEQALARSPALRRQVDAERRVLAGLAALDDAAWNDARATRRHRPEWRAGLAAAAALVLALVVLDALRVDAAPEAPVASGGDDAEVVARLLSRPDVDTLGGRELGLRALGVVALARAEVDGTPDALVASVDWLLAHQTDDGTLRRSPDASDHAVATVALLEASRHVDVPADALDRAVDVLRLRARRAPPPGTHTVDEAWLLQALLLARDLGHDRCDLAIDAVHRSLRAAVPDGLGEQPTLADARRLCVPRASTGPTDDDLLGASRRVLASIALVPADFP